MNKEKIFLILGLFIFTIFLIFNLVDYYSEDAKLDLVPCYDHHNNEMEGLKCMEYKRDPFIDCGLLIGLFFMALYIFLRLLKLVVEWEGENED